MTNRRFPIRNPEHLYNGDALSLFYPFLCKDILVSGGETSLTLSRVSRADWGENAALWAMLFSSLSWDISCSMCLLTGGANSPLWVFTVTCEDSGGEPTNHHPPNPLSLSLSWLSSMTSYRVSPSPPPSFFLFPRSAASGNMPLMSVPLPQSPRGCFTFTNPTSPFSLLLPLLHHRPVPPFISANVHFITVSLMSSKQIITNPVNRLLLTPERRSLFYRRFCTNWRTVNTYNYVSRSPPAIHLHNLPQKSRYWVLTRVMKITGATCRQSSKTLRQTSVTGIYIRRGSDEKQELRSRKPFPHGDQNVTRTC